MKRRQFMTLLGGAAAWPLAARAQQAATPVIGYLDPTSPGDFAEPHRGFLQGLKETGYVESENVAISHRFAENQTDRLPELAADLVRRQVAVIFTFASGVFAAKGATTTIPVVFVGADDPVRLGLVTNIAQPGDHEQVHGCHLRQMVAQEGAPALTRRTAVYAGHVLGHGRLSDRQAELEQLAMNTRCTPKRILNAHSSDQRP